ncbi:MAG: amidase family protein [Granulosicoccus sp.]
MGQIKDKAARAIAAARALGDECDRIFIELNEARILADAAALDASRGANQKLPLYGMTVSLKDLFDEGGKRTTAASRVLQDIDPARRDGDVVARLKAAGALIFGRTNMSEFAYSGVGLNPHHGTPGCIFNKEQVPGGSSSGAALSAAHGLCDIAMGTDTGGSVRLPAAINGLYGFKPSQKSVSLEGVHPLSASYDSVGPLSSSLDLVITCMQVIRHEPLADITPLDRPLKLAIPEDTFTDDLDESVALAFHQSIHQLNEAGHEVHLVSFAELVELTTALRLTVSTEAQAVYKNYLEALKTQGDPHVLARIHQSDGLAESDLATYRTQRQQAIDIYNERLAPFDALLAPTIKCETPTIANAQANFNTVNAALLRNTTYINLVDGCAMTLPVAREDMPPSALMVCGVNGQDAKVIAVSQVVDGVIKKHPA